MNEQAPEQDGRVGVVTARLCECCGHHEIGIVTQGGDYIPLRPGMQVQIIDRARQNRLPPSDANT